jgi:hypothetical protein
LQDALDFFVCAPVDFVAVLAKAIQRLPTSSDTRAMAKNSFAWSSADGPRRPTPRGAPRGGNPAPKRVRARPRTRGSGRQRYTAERAADRERSVGGDSLEL